MVGTARHYPLPHCLTAFARQPPLSRAVIRTPHSRPDTFPVVALADARLGVQGGVVAREMVRVNDSTERGHQLLPPHGTLHPITAATTGGERPVLVDPRRVQPAVLARP
jgi:hypothetical protein